MIRDIALEEEKSGGDFKPIQFHKIYIHRYEQVSILFADIKGFTGIYRYWNKNHNPIFFSSVFYDSAAETHITCVGIHKTC